jgi:hypothetical protein
MLKTCEAPTKRNQDSQIGGGRCPERMLSSRRKTVQGRDNQRPERRQRLPQVRKARWLIDADDFPQRLGVPFSNHDGLSLAVSGVLCGRDAASGERLYSGSLEGKDGIWKFEW